jgi:hypothetical protein
MKVKVSIYDLVGSSTNALLTSVAGGVFHVGIEVADVEWSYGYCDCGSGVFAVASTKCTLGPLREQVLLGETKLRADEIIRILHKLRMEWVGPDYNVMSRNCVFFSKAFLRELNPKLQIPEYCRSLSETAARVADNSGFTKLRSVDQVFGSPEKEVMWREAERLMREFVRNETVDFSTQATVIHSLHLKPLEHSPADTRLLCSRSLYHIRHQNFGNYLQRAPIRRLLLNYR